MEIILDSIINKDKIGQAIIASMKECQGAVNIVSPYVSETNLFDLLKMGSPLRLVCDARSPACNPEVLEKLLEMKVEIRSRRDIHAKVYIFESEAYVTSANATPNGLGHGMIEACTKVGDKKSLFELNEWFENIWSEKDTENVADFSDHEWNTLKANWKLKPKNGKTKKPNLSDLIYSKKLPTNIVFLFWHQTDKAPEQKDVLAKTPQDSIIELPESMKDWDFFIESEDSNGQFNLLKDILKNYYGSLCINIKTNSYPIETAYAVEAVASRLLDKPIRFQFEGEKLILSLYRTDNVNLPFKVDGDAIKLINKSIKENRDIWEKYFETDEGRFGYCSVEALYGLVEGC